MGRPDSLVLVIGYNLQKIFKDGCCRSKERIRVYFKKRKVHKEICII